MPLEKLGPFKLDKVLGRGGMGAVYVGIHEKDGQRAAVKVLAAHLADDFNFRERFKSEVETLKKLLHPNIVRLFGYGEEDGHLYYVMELVDGRSLQDEIAAGRRFTWREVVRIGVDVAKALKHAHDRGVIHRDLKPANLLIDPQDHTKLTDFGIAKLYGGTSITSDGGVIGTADYMSPEQAEGKQITSRSDLYSLGSVLHALLAGRPPFSGKTVLDVMRQLRDEKPIPIRRLCPDAPEELETIILQLLEKDPQKRIPTAIALANRLKAMEHALSLETRIGIENDVKLPPDDVSQRKSHGPTPTSVAFAQQATAELPGDDEYRLSGEMPTIVTGPGVAGLSPPTSGSLLSESSDAGPTSGRRENTAAVEAARMAHFTTVSEAELRRGGTASTGDEVDRGQWIKIALVCLGAVLLLGGVVVYATRPPSADGLYARIEGIAENADPQQLVEADGDIEQFLELYPTDPRTEQLKKYQDEIELYRLQRRFEARMRRSGSAEQLSAVERAYLDAQRFLSSDPDEAQLRFQALVDVFEGAANSGETLVQQKLNQQCVALAKKQVERLSAATPQQDQEQKVMLRQQLGRAEELSKTDVAGAKRILRGLVTLYGDKGWATDIVEQARERLAALDGGN
jgi:eukaryotic-like serine/threonine-protein kinase